VRSIGAGLAHIFLLYMRYWLRVAFGDFLVPLRTRSSAWLLVGRALNRRLPRSYTLYYILLTYKKTSKTKQGLAFRMGVYLKTLFDEDLS